MNQISSHFQFTISFIFSLFLQSSAFLSRDENEKEVGMVGAILIWKDGDEKRNRFSASDIWFMMIMSWLLTIRDIKYLLDSTNQIYIQTEDSLHNTQINQFLQCSLLSHAEILLSFDRLWSAWSDNQNVLPFEHQRTTRTSHTTSWRISPRPVQYVVGAAAKHFPIPCRRQHLASRSVPASSPDAKEQRTWKDYSYLYLLKKKKHAN